MQCSLFSGWNLKMESKFDKCCQETVGEGKRIKNIERVKEKKWQEPVNR